jgi:predicted ATPase
VVVTGGPGAGKTAVLELARRTLCEHVRVLPEAAGIVYGGGFPRRHSLPARRAAQRVIWHTERQLEWLEQAEDTAALVLCDRGTVDGLAYWPGAAEELLAELGTDLATQLARYTAVVHLRTPDRSHGYGHTNPLRTEDAPAARAIDERILELWTGHPDRTVIDEHDDFAVKAEAALAVLRAHVPACCRAVG